MKFIGKKHLMAMLFSVILLGNLSIESMAQSAPYTSLTFDKDDNLVSTMDGYVPNMLWDKFGDTVLKKPSDLFIFDNREIYIADTGNGRILVVDMKGNYLREYAPDGFKGPTGVFVNSEKEIYVADPGAKKIFLLNPEGEIVETFETPVSPLFGKNAKYEPNKVVVNEAGTIYALSSGNSGGVLTISKYGDFYGYFGANDTDLSLGNKIKRAIFTEEQLSNMQKNVPASAINLDIDDTGLIYTVTQGLGNNGLKKYNLAGTNMFNNAFADSLVNDVCVGSIDNIFTLSKRGYILEYSKDGELLFYFGGSDDGKNRMGLFTNAVAIDVDDDNNIFVLDGDKGDITVLTPTEYSVTVHEALNLYQDGFYLESSGPWEKVLSQNSLFDFAYRGIAKAKYKLSLYREAMENARLGGSKGTYSSAFWQVRNQWIRKNIVNVFWILIIFSLLRFIWKRFGDRIVGIRNIKAALNKFKNVKTIKELRFLKYVLKNPADAFYGIKREGKVSLGSATLVYIIIFAIYLVNKYYSGFLFKSVADGQYDLVADIAMVPGLMLLFVMCCNMICSVRDGEATLKTMYISFAYCFMPYIFLKPPVFVLSHVLTYNESFLISLLNFLIVAGTGILIVVMIRENQCYSYKETIVNILLTLFTMLVVIVAAIILFALFKQVIDFVIGIFKEGYYRGR